MTGDVFTVDLVAPERFSMSFLRAAESCLFRAHHERKANSSGPDALIGRIFHEVAAVLGTRCSMQGRESPDYSEAMTVARRAMGNPDDHDPLSFSAWQEVFGLLGRWVRSDRARFAAGEQFEIGWREDLGGRTLSGRIDRLLVDGNVARARDYKTGWGDPASELTLQGRIYSWRIFRTHPEVDVVYWTEEHVRFGIDSGPAPGEHFVVTRDDCAETEEFLLTAIERIENAYAAGVLPATPGSGCSSPGRCPVAGMCPQPKWARPATFISDEADALAQFEAMMVEEARLEERKSAIRGYLLSADKRSLQHNGQEIGWAESGGKSFDRKRLEADLAGDGGSVDFSEYEKPTKPAFGRRKAK